MGTDDTTWHTRGACELSRLAPPGSLLGTLMLAALIATLACHSGPADAQQPVGTAGTAPPGAAVAVPARQLREFSVTAYCTGRVTQSGARVKPGMAAADPRVLPAGTTLRVDGQGKAYDGIYTVTDTGREIKGRELDLYLGSCNEAEQFGRRTMQVAVIRRGWDPKATPPPLPPANQ